MEGPICCNFACSGATLRGVPEPFRHRIRVRFNECDGQGVVFYANYLMYFDVAMTELWRDAFGGGYAGMIADGTDAMVAEANIRYRASARFDDELDLVAAVTRIGTTSTLTHLTAERVADGAVLAEADLRHVFIDPDSLEKREIPDEVRLGMGRYAG
jgi:acyl-CoA thioester hydrolase